MSIRTAPKFVLVTMALLAGCASPGRRIDERAMAAGLEAIRADSAPFPSLIYMKHPAARATASQGPLLVFLEGDGIPWRAGRVPNTDPTTHNPVALELLIRSPAPAAYLTRPCYQGLRSRNCTSDRWTGGRYSVEIVASMVASVREAQRRSGAREVTLIGHSGGGVLAVLIAERLERVNAVVTLAANLDTEAWTAHHGYLLLSQSLNPSRSERPHPWPEVHLQGGQDTVAPPATTSLYFERYPRAQRKVIAEYDHVCCWVRDWAALLSELPLESSSERPVGGQTP